MIVKPHIRARMTMVMAQPGWWRNLARIEAGFAVLEAAREVGFHIHILTKGPRAHPLAWAEKALLDGAGLEIDFQTETDVVALDAHRTRHEEESIKKPGMKLCLIDSFHR